MNILKKIAKWSFLAWALVAIVMIALWLLNAPKDLAENSESKSRLNQAQYAVSKMDLAVIDPSRLTPAMGKFEGSDKRTLNGAIWFPKGQSTGLPLIIYSHGFGGYHKDSTYLAEYLASNGYIVAAVDFPLSKALSPAGVPQLLDVVNQPGDVSAVIDQILVLNNAPNSALYNRLDINNIGTMGLSLGGLTTALISFHPDLKDERIKAVVMMAPPLEAFSNQFYATNSKLNSLLISGSMDRVVPEPENAVQVRERHPNGWFISLDKGTHLGFADIGNPIRYMENPDNLGCTLMGFMLKQLDLPERWDSVIPNTNGILRDIVVRQPCPDLAGKSMNGLKQQWLTSIATESFFDMYLRSGARAQAARDFFTGTLSSENPEVRLTSPR
ncbi:MAG: putative dienelactone hydrolase [Polaribacter sp.]|jgi:predicted dienelactone hydrolase